MRRHVMGIWKTTKACDLACFRCRASAHPKHHPRELNTEEAQRLIRDVAELHPPIFILTGGDPLKRSDIYDLVRYETTQGIHPAMTPSATPHLSRTGIGELKKCWLFWVAVSLDGCGPELHDKFRGVSGS